MDYRKKIEQIVNDLEGASDIATSRIADHIREVYLDSGLDTGDASEIFSLANDIEDMAFIALKVTNKLRKLTR